MPWHPGIATAAARGISLAPELTKRTISYIVADVGNACTDLLRQVVSAHRKPSGPPGRQVLVGLLGRGIQLSRTPAMHEREAARLGLGCAYVLVDFDVLGLADGDLSDVLAAGLALGFQGFNVTHPFKQAIIPQLDALAPEAAAIGAVNTVVFAGGRSTGHNTDSWGFAESFRHGLSDVPRASVLQFGAGGAGAAVAHALMQLGTGTVRLFDSDAARSQALASRMHKHWGDRIQVASDVAAALADADGVVNTTPVGMAKYPGIPFPPEHLRPDHWVAEIIYFPAETELLRLARHLGCRALAGTGMAIGQAVRAFELFTGRPSTMAAMAGHFAAA